MRKTKSNMKNILIITGRYLPGYKDGGPVRTIKNLTDMYGDKYHFTVACADRDHGDTSPYENMNVGVNAVNRVGKTDVVYIENGKFRFSDIIYLASKNDLVYLCGPYNGYAIKTLLLNRIGKIKVPVVLAPMGSFSKGALAIRSKKKNIFLSLVKMLGLFENLYFSITSEVEKKEMKDAINTRKEIVSDDKCFIAEDPQRSPDSFERINKLKHNETSDKTDDNSVLKVVFLSRICEKKNLLGAAKILSRVKGNVIFHIYGNMEDENYYIKCENVLKNLPENIRYEYKGEADSELVPGVLSEYDVFLFPTQGENFGHVISESLLAGTIPVISDTTPWLDFNEKGVGYVIPLNDEDAFVECIDGLCNMSRDEILTLSGNAQKYYKEKYEYASNNSGYTDIFDSLS